MSLRPRARAAILWVLPPLLAIVIALTALATGLAAIIGRS